VNRVVYVRNLPFKISSENMFDIFGKYGPIRQIRLGDRPDTRGTAFVIFEDIFDAKTAVDHLSGFCVAGRYLVVLYYKPAQMKAKANAAKQEAELANLRKEYGMDKGDNDA